MGLMLIACLSTMPFSPMPSGPGDAREHGGVVRLISSRRSCNCRHVEPMTWTTCVPREQLLVSFIVAMSVLGGIGGFVLGKVYVARVANARDFSGAIAAAYFAPNFTRS